MKVRKHLCEVFVLHKYSGDYRRCNVIYYLVGGLITEAGVRLICYYKGSFKNTYVEEERVFFVDGIPFSLLESFFFLISTQLLLSKKSSSPVFRDHRFVLCRKISILE